MEKEIFLWKNREYTNMEVKELFCAINEWIVRGIVQYKKVKSSYKKQKTQIVKSVIKNDEKLQTKGVRL